MKTISVSLFFFLVIASFNVQSQEIFEFRDSTLHCKYEMVNGRFDGTYTSYYSNGNVRAKGRLKNNYPMGVWEVFDSTNQLLFQRIYRIPFNFVYGYTSEPMKEPEIYALGRSPDGTISYYGPLKESMIVWAKRIWRNIYPENNAVLFHENDLLEAILEAAYRGEIKLYSDEDFQVPLSESEIKKLPSGNLTSMRIYEDWFYDNHRWIMESRIMGICPVINNSKTGKDIPLFWVYLPEARRTLASLTLETPPESHLTNLDDILFFRAFSSSIYKEENVFDREIKAYKTGSDIETEALKIDLMLVETQISLWMMAPKEKE